ncbi:hypothetical protein EGW08_014890 [Elysia chlorotica]|uniref:Glypican-1 n=1 Tax=Elysia chlorotica TaxID=188477 RepID=A0A433T728_ELYCH|nr:hypothetical protein EGW08_014890 [Elysia chlorotica]
MAPTDSCVKAIVRMTYCPVCRGLTSTKPCSFYCLNIMKGCLANHAELNDDWNKYVDALNKLAERLDGPFNIESVVAPIDVDISNAIMNMQETGVAFTQEVVKECGEINQLKQHHLPPMPRSKREAQGPQGAHRFDYPTSSSSHSAHNNHQSPLTQEHTFDLRRQQRPSPPQGAGGRKKGGRARQGKQDCKASGTCLDRLVKDLKDKLKPAKDFWVSLPYMVCQEERLAADATVQDDCWNGTDRARYVAEVQEDGVLRQINNPEVEVDVQVVNSVFNRQRIQLQHITSKLNSAYEGKHVEWDETGMETFVGGSGSGNDFLYDDEDEDIYSDEDDDVGDDVDDGSYGKGVYDDRDDGFSDDEDELLEASGHGYQGSGSGSHGIITEEEQKGYVNIDLSPHKYTPTGSGGGRGRGHGGNRDRFPHRKGGNGYIGMNGNGGTVNGNRGTDHGNNPTIVNPGGGMYNPDNNNNRNIYKPRGENGGEIPTVNEGSQDGEKDAASCSSAGNALLVLLLFSFHWLAVRRFLCPSLSVYFC